MIRYFIRHYWRYLAMALAFATITFLINSCEVKAQPINTGLYIGNTQLLGNNKLYNAGSQNVQVQIRPDSHTLNSTSRYQYGYIAICSATGKDNPVTALSFNTTIMNSAQAYMSNESCQIPNSTAYTETARILYITYYVNIEVLYSEDQYGNFYWLNNPTFTFYQGPSTEYSLVGYGFSNTPYRVNSEATLYDQVLNSIQQALTTINGSIVFLQQKLDITNGKIDIVNGKLDITNSRINYINDKLDELLEQNKVCNYIDKINVKDNGYLTSNGGINGTDLTNIKVTDYIQISNKTKIKLLEPKDNETLRTCFYNINKENISCIQNNEMVINEYLNIPNNASFVRFTINIVVNKPKFEICDTAQNITNQQNQQIIQGNTDINNSINDSSIDDPDNDLLDMENHVASNSVISDLLLLPINMFQRIVNSIGGTCSTFNLGTLWGSSLTMPCINIENLIGSNLWAVIDILFCGIFVLSIRKKFVDIFENITSLKDRGNELE